MYENAGIWKHAYEELQSIHEAHEFSIDDAMLLINQAKHFPKKLLRDAFKYLAFKLFGNLEEMLGYDISYRRYHLVMAVVDEEGDLVKRGGRRIYQYLVTDLSEIRISVMRNWQYECKTNLFGWEKIWFHQMIPGLPWSYTGKEWRFPTLPYDEMPKTLRKEFY